MNDCRIEPTSDVAVFRGSGTILLADVVTRVDAELGGTDRRDTLSAFRVLAARGGVDLAATPAHVPVVRDLLAALTARGLAVTPKRLANIRSLIGRAVARFGMPRTWVTREIELAPAWAALLELAPKREYRWSLGRLACYCTVKGLAPADVRPETLRGFLEALEGDCIVREPRKILKQTIAIWNMCRRSTEAWPRARLASPFKGDPYMLPLTAFPASFQRDVAAWETRMTTPDPLDPDAPVRALRPATIEAYRFTFRRLASALVRRDVLAADQITGFDVLLEGDHLRAALRAFLPADGQTSGYVHKMATQMATIARHHLKLDRPTLDAIAALLQRLDPKTAGRMGPRNHTRLGQFDDPAVVQRLLRFPEEEYARALSASSAMRRAKGVERALAISLLIFAGVRVQNLRTLRCDRNLVRSADRVFLRFTAAEMKTAAPLELELPADTIRLLDAFLEDHRGRLAGAAGPYLFPGPEGGARSYSAMRDAVSAPLRKHAGIALSPHLYRHIIAKIVAERAPELLTDLSRRLGHKSINTTYQAYLGTETPAASRRINRLLEATRAEPRLGSKS